MQFLQQALDDPDPKPCGRCSVCTGELPEPGTAPSEELIVAARTFFRGQDAIVEPRKLWAARLGDRKGKINFLGAGAGAGVRRRPRLDRHPAPALGPRRAR